MTDVFALGGLLYFLLTDRPPFRGETASGTLRAVIGEDPPSPRTLRPGIPEDLEAICLRCLEKRPSRRYASVRDVMEDVDRFLAGEPVLARGEARLPRWSVATRRKAAWAVAMAVVGIAAAWAWKAVDRALAAARAEARMAIDVGATARERASFEVTKARRERYAAHVQLAFETFNQGARESVVEALQREVPRPGEPDVRGWEWGFLGRACAAATASLPSHATNGSAPTLPGNAWTLTFTNLAPGVVGSGLLGDGSRAWTASSSALQAWDVASGKLLHDLPADAEAMKSALWMKGDGSEAWVARAWVGGRLGLRALGIEASTVSVEEPEWQPVPRYSGALDLSFSADGTRIVLADVANGVRVHAVPSMEVVRRMPGVAARRAELSPTGSRIAATTSDGKVWTWGIGSGVTHAWTADVPQAQEVAFSPDGQRVLAVLNGAFCQCQP